MLYEVITAQIELAEEVGSTTKREYSHEVNDEELKTRMWDELYDKVYKAARLALLGI